MNYEERYNQALERAKKVHDGELTISPNEVNDFNVYEYIFHELRESEDERIRKILIELIKGITSWNYFLGISKEQMIAWLEKQGEKSVDETKPKFNIGDWITNGYYTWKVTDIKPLDYILQSPNGDMVDDTISYVDEEFHLWTIQDTKDGDVLAAHECLVLFKEIDGLNIRCYCTYHYLNSESFYIDTLQNKAAFQPATKEQCNILFQKMKEEGYVWYAEKKELKKLEQKPVKAPKFKVGDKIRYLNSCGTIMTIEKIENGEYIFSNNMGHTTIEEGNKWFLVEQRTAEWSEEDDIRLDHLIGLIQKYGLNYYESIDKVIDIIHWLKSIKPHWKPSEEQMEALKKRTHGLHTSSETRKALESLINDLKTL